MNRREFVAGMAVAPLAARSWLEGAAQQSGEKTSAAAEAGRLLFVGTQTTPGTSKGIYTYFWDHATGELHAIAYFWAWDHVQHVIIGAGGAVSRTTDIPVADGPMMHDFALTPGYVVLLDLPVTFSLDAVSAGMKLPYTWNPAHQARVGLLPRGGTAAGVRWFEVDPCWVFHTLNAYDDDGRVVVDLSGMRAPTTCPK